MGLKTQHLNLNGTAIKGWMALYDLLWRFGIVPQHYETLHGLAMLIRLQIRLQNRKDNVN